MRSRPSRLASAVAAVALLGACADPIGDDGDEGEAAEDPIGAQEPDPARDALAAEVATLAELLTTAHDHLQAAAQADDVAGARADADAVVDLLIGDPTDGSSALFPVETGERGAGSDRADQLTSVLTVAREAGGAAGRDVRETLRDLVAGDLGAWQRDADGMVASVEAAATSAGNLEATEQAVLELPGEVTRALAWALLATDAGDLDGVTAYAERGAAHLDIAATALTDLDVSRS